MAALMLTVVSLMDGGTWCFDEEKENPSAITDMAMSLMRGGRINDSISVCMIPKHPDAPDGWISYYVICDGWPICYYLLCNQASAAEYLWRHARRLAENYTDADEFNCPTTVPWLAMAWVPGAILRMSAEPSRVRETIPNVVAVGIRAAWALTHPVAQR